MQTGTSHANGRLIKVIYDHSSADCRKALEILKLRECSLPRGPTVTLIEWPSAFASSLLSDIDDRLRNMNLGKPWEMQHKMIAILPSGLVLPNCEADVMQLVYEMEYISMIQPPTPDMIAHIESHLNPLRERSRAGRGGEWWCPQANPDVVLKVAGSLEDIGFCVLDNFLSPSSAEKLAAGVSSSRPDGYIPAEGKQGWTRGGTARVAEAIHAEGDFEKRNELLARHLMSPTRGDVLKYSEGDGTIQGTQDMCSNVDKLVMGLKQCPQVAHRLDTCDFANPAMCSVYPGGAARYIKHTDNSIATDGRRLTTILYLNRDWQPEHGGHLRIFEPTMQSMRYKRDVEPIWNRLLLFWSTEEVPHEVMPSYCDRTAVSIWYVDSKECLQTEDAFKRLVAKVRCIGGQDKVERMIAAGDSKQQRELLRIAASAPDLLAKDELQERHMVLTAVDHDFGGCDAHRRMRERLNLLFGWDARAAEVQQQILQAQMQQLGMFEALGLGAPPGVRTVSAPVSTAPHALTKDYCRRASNEPKGSKDSGFVQRVAMPGSLLSSSAGCVGAKESCSRAESRTVCASGLLQSSSTASLKSKCPDGVWRKLPDIFEVVD